MMRNWMLGVLMLGAIALYAQNTYEAAAGDDYWKNRKPFDGYWQQDVHYRIKAVIDDQEESVKGGLMLTYYNNSPDTLYEVYFHLYQNAFTPNSYAHELREQGKLKTTFGVHEQKGIGTSIQKFLVDGHGVEYSIDNTILNAKLNQPLLPGGSIRFSIDFKTYWDKDDGGNMRRRMKTFYHDDVIHFDGVHWYPRIAAYDRKFGWTTDQHLGKEFYGDFGLFEVDLTFPSHYVVEATGELIAPALNEDEREALDLKNYRSPRTDITKPLAQDGKPRTWKYRAVNVHDFAFTADPTYRIGEAEWNGIKCMVMAQERNAHKWQPTAKFLSQLIELYSNEIGMYRYPKIVAADARDGMEYPMLTLNSGNWPGHMYVIAHEVGHNWFFGMVGNNETYRSSLDEGFTQFLTALSLKKISKQDHYGNAIDQQAVFNRYIEHASNFNNATLNVHADHYNSADRHGGGYGQVYFKTATMLYNLQYVLGDELFQKAIHHYFEQYRFCHPYWEDFRSSVIRYTKVDLNWFFDQWITTTKTIDYRIRRSIQKADTHLIEIERKGEMQMPLDVRVEFADGSARDFYIPNTVFVKRTTATVMPSWVGWDMIHPTYTLKFTESEKVKQVIIDPSGRLADINRLNNYLQTPVETRFSKYRATFDDYYLYNLRYHPKLWYNSVHGVKPGIELMGRSHSDRHRFNLSVWYNTGLLAADSTAFNDPVNFDLSYTHRVADMLNLKVNSRWLDGLQQHEVALRKIQEYHFIEVGVKTMYRASDTDVDISLYPELWESMKWNNSLNATYYRRFRKKNGGANLQVDARGSFLHSDYAYAYLRSTYQRNAMIGRAVLNVRGIGQWGTGDFAPESQLMLASANAEEMANDPWVRSQGIVPKSWVGYDAASYRHFNYAGGLNLRGFSGTYPLIMGEGGYTPIYSGTGGAAINAELDLSDYIKLERNMPNWFFDSYLFGDMGWLYDGTAENDVFCADAGLGFALTRRFSKYSHFKPITLRVDLPLFVNRIPSNSTSGYWDLRYVFGINRLF